jgi:hypothetical protein
MKRFSFFLVFALVLSLTVPSVSGATEKDKSFSERKHKTIHVNWNKPNKDVKDDTSEKTKIKEHEIPAEGEILPSSSVETTPQQDGQMSIATVNGISIDFMMVPLEGSSQVEAWWRVNDIIGDEPDKVEMKFTLAGRDSRDSGSYYPITGYSKVVTIYNPYEGQSGETSAFSFTQTKYTILLTEVKYYEDGVLVATSSDTDGQRLLNKVAYEYPPYTDPYSGKFMMQPARTDWAKTTSISWTTTDRNKYTAWYDNTYPNHSWIWNNGTVEIHHIRPRNYGGTNDYSNLVPIPTQRHYDVSSWWTNY